jgi:glycosyltransferase involved in cell wall biosynthesis
MKEPSQIRQCAEALKGAAAVISVSGGLAEAAIDLGVNPANIFVIPNGVDARNFNIKDQTECRRKLGLPFDKRLLVTVAHLGHRKGHHEVIQALAGLPEDITLVLVGGAAQDGTSETIMDMAKSFGVEKRVILAGPQPYEKVALYFSAADASVLASYREGCPNAVLESLACGIPVVATDVGAVKDILPVPDAGRIVP